MLFPAWWLLLALLVLVPPGLLAQLTPAPAKITKINLTNVGPQIVSEALIKANIRVKEGDMYNRAAVDDDVRNLYTTGYFYNVRVAEDRSADGVVLLYMLQARPVLTEIIFTGNKKYSRTQLFKKVSLTDYLEPPTPLAKTTIPKVSKTKMEAMVGQPLDERRLFSFSQEIKKLYQKNGYPKTECKYVLNIDERAGRGTVTFEITEAQKIRIEDVFFEGARDFSQRKLRKELKTRRHWFWSWLTRSGVLKDEQLEDDKEKLAEFYRSRGYIDFELKDLKFVQVGPRKMILHLVISEGRRYKVGAISYKGVTLFPTNDISKKLKMKVGDYFTPKGLTTDIEAIRDLYGNKGHIDTIVIARKTPNTQTGTMDLDYELEEKEKAFIEKIEIKGNTRTKDRVIRRELAVAPGELFDMTKVKLSKDRVEGTRLFERIEMQPEPTDVPNRRNLVVAVNERDTGKMGFGAGFSSVDSLLGFVEVAEENFQLPWFRGGGQKLRLRAQLGNVRQDYVLTFIEPWLFGKKLEFTSELYHHDLRNVSLNDFYEERLTGMRMGLTRALGRDSIRVGVSYTIENISILNVPDNAPQTIKDEAGTRLESRVGTSLAYDTRRTSFNVFLPDGGQRTELLTQVAGGPLGGDTDYYKLELRHNLYFKGLAQMHVLEFGGRLGVVDHYGRSTRVPLISRWFLGGIDTLRGYRQRQVGPQVGGEPVGGGTYWFGTMEYSIPIIELLRVAVFYDIGMVYQNPYSFDALNNGTGFYNDNWGLGLRLNIPQLGPLRLDYGIPIRAATVNDSNGRFQFSVGWTREY